MSASSAEAGGPRSPASGDRSGGPWIRALAPAKVNPYLEVLRRRPDGFHEVDTVMLALDLCDVVEVRARREPGVSIELFGPQATADVPADGRNLASRATLAVLERAGVADRRGLELRLEKRVPSQAGLGGGSSDAAAAVLAAERALGIELAGDERVELLAELGSDCVFFVRAAATGLARCTGRGERVTPLPAVRQPWTIGVLVPELRCPTAAVYGALEFPLWDSGAVPTFKQGIFEKSVAAVQRSLFNRLEEPALRAVPGLRPWRALLDSDPEHRFQLSGSGSAFFGIFGRWEDARAVLEEIAAEGRRRGLPSRGVWCSRPLGSGAVLRPRP